MRFRRFTPSLLLALGIGVAVVTLNVLLARQLVAIEQDAREIVETWITRSATLATFEDGVREFRRHEALSALSTPGAEHTTQIAILDSLRVRTDDALDVLSRLDANATADGGTMDLRQRWTSYRELHVRDRSLPSGVGSPAMGEFRAREPLFQGMVGAARRAQETMRAGAAGLAMHSQRSTRASQWLLIARLFLILTAIVLAELFRRSWQKRTQAEQRWQDVADQSVGIVWELGPTGRFRFLSRSGIELLGGEPSAISGRRVLGFVHAGDRKPALLSMADAARDHAPIRDLEVRMLRVDGSVRWLAISAQPLRSSDGRHDGFRGLAVDVTRRTQAERALAQGRRMEAVGTLAGGVAHDLNNVLAAVSGYAQLAQAELAATHPVQPDLAAITAASDRGAALVRRILQFARQRPAVLQPVEIAELVHEVVQLLRPQLPPHVRIELTVPDGECFVLGDPTELHQVVVNIAANAMHAMREQGTRLVIAVSTTATDVSVMIADDGTGMLPTVMERAVEPFYTTREIGEGTGMGLAVAHGVVTSLGGTLILDSTPGSGTRVTVTLPRAPAGADLPPERSCDDDGTVSLRVLIVDDDPHVRNATARRLERAGHRVETFAAATPALAALQADASRADVVFTDQTMPGMNGLEFVAQLHAIGGAPPVVMSSGYLDLATIERARALGVVAMLDKPVDAGTLLRTLRETVARTPAASRP